MLSEDEDDYGDEDDDDDDDDEDLDGMVRLLSDFLFFLPLLINFEDDSDDDDLPPPRHGAGRGGRAGRGPPANVNPEECKQQ